MRNFETHQKQNRQSAAGEALTIDQLEQVAGGKDIFNFGPHLSSGPILPPPPVGLAGPNLPIGPGPLTVIGLIMGSVSN